MSKALWTKIAEDDLAEIAYYIAVEDRRPIVADRIIDELLAAAEKCAAIPQAGQRHPELRKEWLYRRHKRWLIFYQPIEDGIQVLRVVDGSRDLPNVI